MASSSSDRHDDRPWTGGCQCGELRYAIERDAIQTLYGCHCLECQRQSGSAFGLSLTLEPRGLRITRGKPRSWVRIADTGATNRAHFCPTCGVRLYHDGGEDSDWISLKAGTLDETGGLRPVGHIWTKRAQPWVTLPESLLLYEGQPESYDALIAAWREGAGRSGS